MLLKRKYKLLMFLGVLFVFLVAFGDLNLCKMAGEVGGGVLESVQKTACVGQLFM
ncbi:hypothetical protein [Clostridium hydrogenum]|uniref:hypothetical protein n=1 Tax=Clostridium hydrogenum TaxID=2855764 RepID=UPI001F18C364|nr:hypothetical protein [Clostridium hydrogenum]